MSWHKITLPLSMEIDPNVVKIGDMAKAIFARENKPDGFGMFHATRGSKGGYEDKFLVYLTPVASELCRQEIGESFTLEPCDVPARDEPHMSWVFGDPRSKNLLKDKFEPPPGTFEWQIAEDYKAQMAQMQAEWEAAQAAAAAEAKAEADGQGQ